MCKNEQATISAALDSLAWADDLVVVDSGSTDGTLDLIRAHSVKPRLLQTGWPGYNAQRQFMVAQCKNPWVFMLDADEECSPQLANELCALTDANLAKAAMAQMPRKNYLAGRYVRCWSPDLQSRLIHRDRITWNPYSQFDSWRPKEHFGTLTLRNYILHRRTAPTTLSDFNDAVVRAERAELMSDHLYKQGKRATLFNLLFHPPMTFFKYYILRGAFLDGRFGLVVAYKSTIGVMLKYSTLYSRELVDNSPPSDNRSTDEEAESK